MAQQAVWFVVRDEDVSKVMAAVQALQLSPPAEAEDEVGGFLLASPSLKLPGGGGLPTKVGRPGPRLPGGGGVADTIKGTSCSTTDWGADGGCSDCGLDA